MKWYQTLAILLFCSLLFCPSVIAWGQDLQPQNPEKQSSSSKHDTATEKSSSRLTSVQSTKNATLIAGLTIFVLAVFVGFEVITKVPPTLHTPLMSGSNAISGITLVGAIIVSGMGTSTFAHIVGAVAVALATVNVVGGFLVTHRMLAMFKKRK